MEKGMIRQGRRTGNLGRMLVTAGVANDGIFDGLTMRQNSDSFAGRQDSVGLLSEEFCGARGQ